MAPKACTSPVTGKVSTISAARALLSLNSNKTGGTERYKEKLLKLRAAASHLKGRDKQVVTHIINILDGPYIQANHEMSGFSANTPETFRTKMVKIIEFLEQEPLKEW